MYQDAAADREMWNIYRGNPSPDIRERIIKRYLYLVKFVVGRMTITPPPGLDYDDLHSYGVIGLLDAVERFDLDRGFKFETFAYPRIRGAVIDELRKFDWLSRSMRDKLSRLEEAYSKVLQEKHEIDDDEVRKELAVDEKEYRQLLEIAHRSYTLSLDYILELEDDEVTVGDVISDDTALSQEDVVLKRDMIETLAKCIDKLPEKEKLTITLYYHENLTLKEISRVLDVSESRVSQLHGRAISMLKAMMNS